MTKPFDPQYIEFDGTPIQGRTPALLRVHPPPDSSESTPEESDEHAEVKLTDAQESALQQAFHTYCQSKRLSVASNHGQSTELPDGSRVRFSTVHGLDTIDVWPIPAIEPPVLVSGIGIVFTDIDGAPLPAYRVEVSPDVFEPVPVVLGYHRKLKQWHKRRLAKMVGGYRLWTNVKRTQWYAYTPGVQFITHGNNTVRALHSYTTKSAPFMFSSPDGHLLVHIVPSGASATIWYDSAVAIRDLDTKPVLVPGDYLGPEAGNATISIPEPLAADAALVANPDGTEAVAVSEDGRKLIRFSLTYVYPDGIAVTALAEDLGLPDEEVDEHGNQTVETVAGLEPLTYNYTGLDSFGGMSPQPYARVMNHLGFFHDVVQATVSHHYEHEELLVDLVYTTEGLQNVIDVRDETTDFEENIKSEWAAGTKLEGMKVGPVPWGVNDYVAKNGTAQVPLKITAEDTANRKWVVQNHKDMTLGDIEFRRESLEVTLYETVSQNETTQWKAVPAIPDGAYAAFATDGFYTASDDDWHGYTVSTRPFKTEVVEEDPTVKLSGDFERKNKKLLLYHAKNKLAVYVEEKFTGTLDGTVDLDPDDPWEQPIGDVSAAVVDEVAVVRLVIEIDGEEKFTWEVPPYATETVYQTQAGRDQADFDDPAEDPKEERTWVQTEQVRSDSDGRYYHSAPYGTYFYYPQVVVPGPLQWGQWSMFSVQDKGFDDSLSVFMGFPVPYGGIVFWLNLPEGGNLRPPGLLTDGDGSDGWGLLKTIRTTYFYGDKPMTGAVGRSSSYPWIVPKVSVRSEADLATADDSAVIATPWEIRRDETIDPVDPVPLFTLKWAEDPSTAAVVIHIDFDGTSYQSGVHKSWTFAVADGVLTPVQKILGLPETTEIRLVDDSNNSLVSL